MSARAVMASRFGFSSHLCWLEQRARLDGISARIEAAGTKVTDGGSVQLNRLFLVRKEGETCHRMVAKCVPRQRAAYTLMGCSM